MVRRTRSNIATPSLAAFFFFGSSARSATTESSLTLPHSPVSAPSYLPPPSQLAGPSYQPSPPRDPNLPSPGPASRHPITANPRDPTKTRHTSSYHGCAPHRGEGVYIFRCETLPEGGKLRWQRTVHWGTNHAAAFGVVRGPGEEGVSYPVLPERWVAGLGNGAAR